MKQLLFCIGTLGTLLVTNTIQAQDVKKTRTISGVGRVRASMGIETFVRVGDTESLHIEAKNISEDKILIEQDGDELILKLGLDVSLEKKHPNRSVRAYLTVKQLRAVSVTAGASVTGETPFKADKFDLTTKAGALAKLDLRVGDLTVNCNSGASIDLSGTAHSMSVSAGSGADVDAGKLIADSVNARAGSGASVRVNAKNTFMGKASLGGSVVNRGPGQAASRSMSLGGRVD